LKIEKEVTAEAPGDHPLVKFLHTETDSAFRDYDDLTCSDKYKNYFPTGTCIPLNKKIFLNASGKILPCERVDHKHVLGYVTEKKVIIDFKKIADKYNRYFDKMRSQCTACDNIQRCPTCILKVEITNNEFKCADFGDENETKKSFSKKMTYLEENPELYSKIMEEVFLE
jgi:uncharacterized protein